MKVVGVFLGVVGGMFIGYLTFITGGAFGYTMSENNRLKEQQESTEETKEEE